MQYLSRTYQTSHQVLPRLAKDRQIVSQVIKRRALAGTYKNFQQKFHRIFFRFS